MKPPPLPGTASFRYTIRFLPVSFSLCSRPPFPEFHPTLASLQSPTIVGLATMKESSRLLGMVVLYGLAFAITAIGPTQEERNTCDLSRVQRIGFLSFAALVFIWQPGVLRANRSTETRKSLSNTKSKVEIFTARVKAFTLLLVAATQPFLLYLGGANMMNCLPLGGILAWCTCHALIAGLQQCGERSSD